MAVEIDERQRFTLSNKAGKEKGEKVRFHKVAEILSRRIQLQLAGNFSFFQIYEVPE